LFPALPAQHFFDLNPNMRVKINRAFFRSIFFLLALVGASVESAENSSAKPGHPQIGNVYKEFILLDDKRRIVLPDGTWEVNNVFDDRMHDWHSSWKVVTLINRDPKIPFYLTTVRYFSVSIPNWGVQECEKKSNPHAFFHDTTGTKGSRSVCSNFYDFADPAHLLNVVLPSSFKFHWAKALSKLDKEFVRSLPTGLVMLAATANKGGGLYIMQEVLLDAQKLGVDPKTFRYNSTPNLITPSIDILGKWRINYVSAMAQSFLERSEIPAATYALNITVPEVSSNKLAKNDLGLTSEPAQKRVGEEALLNGKEDAISKADLLAKESEQSRAKAQALELEREQARVQAEILTREKEQASLRADSLAKEKEHARAQAEALIKDKEQARIKAEALAKENEEARARAEILAKEKEKERARAESLAKESEEARRQAEIRIKMLEEAAAKEARAKEAALVEANKKIAELMEQAKSASKAQSVGDKSNKRKALLIGNDRYQTVTPLKNAGTDAHAMGKALSAFGYKVWVKTDLNRRDMHAAIRQFKAEVEGGDEVVVFYAGHAVQIGAANYLLPTDIVGSSEDEVKDDAIQLQRLLEDMGERKTQITLAMIDACRDNPFKKSGRNIGGRGLAPTAAATGQMIIFSAGVGQQALDRLSNDDQDPNGLFTRIFIKEMKTPGQRIDNLAREVRKKVVEAAKAVGHEQVPAIYDQVVGDFYFSQ
jgi:hypothetical protein